MVDAEALAEGTFDDEATIVLGSVMATAKRQHALRVVGAAVGTPVDVMQLEEGRAPAARDGAAAVVATEDLAADRRRDRLGGADGSLRASVDGADVLRVAQRLLDDLGSDSDRLSAAILVASAAAATNAERDLVGRTIVIAVSEHGAGEHADQVVIADVTNRLIAEPVPDGHVCTTFRLRRDTLDGSPRRDRSHASKLVH